MNIEKIILENQGTIVDVRSPEEFLGGHVVGSINIPLQEIPQRITELNKFYGSSRTNHCNAKNRG